MAGTCGLEDQLQRADDLPDAGSGGGVELAGSPAAEGHHAAASGDRSHGLVKGEWVAVDGGLEGVAEVLRHVVGVAGRVADDADVHDVGVAGDLVPPGGQLRLREKGALEDQVEMRVPLACSRIPSDFKKRDATSHGSSPPAAPPQAAEAPVETIELVGKVSVRAAEGESDEPVGLPCELGDEVVGDAGCTIVAAGAAESVPTAVTCDADCVGVVAASEHPGT